MDRRVFLKVTGVVAAASALEALPVAAERLPDAVLAERAPGLGLGSALSTMRVAVREPGTYQISGSVRLDAPRVEISGITHTQWISWSAAEGPEHPVAVFTTFERFDLPGATQAIQVRGGQLESLAVVPMEYD